METKKTEHKHELKSDEKKTPHTHETKTETNHEHKTETHTHPHAEHKTEAIKTEEKKTETKKETPKKVSTGIKKTEAIVNGRDLAVSIKHATALCNMIRGKEIDEGIKLVEEVTKMKRAVKMRGEIPHRHGMMSGRFPIKAAGIYLRLLKSLKSNGIANELELEKYEIFAMPNVAPRPYRRFGSGRFKRSHLLIKLIPMKTKIKQPKIIKK